MISAFNDFAARLSDEAMRWGHKAKAERGIDGLISIAVGEALMRVAHMARDTASGMEAPSGGETGTGSTEGDSPVGEAETP